MDNGTDSLKGLNLKQLGVLAGTITEDIAKILNPQQITYWVKNENRKALTQKLRQVFSVKNECLDERIEWQKFYKDQFNWTMDFSRILIPEKPGEGWRLIIIAKGMTMNVAFARCKKLFKTYQYADDLNVAISTNIRTATDHYAVWVRDGIEPDHEHLGKSTRQADPDMKIGITVLERIILELKYFSETGNHLDVKGVTFCSGSRGSGGFVPSAYWGGGGFGVGWYFLDYSYSVDGIRSAVSL